ncbi:MAG: phosphatidate cytidylyltransferase [Candidatus Pelagibacter sp.]|nr:phosphatidate cytidylyltransferase [Candidatus Pelagibacter sp.]OUW11640.1 MAG: hypothetical protein CBD26_00925 [Candidatus Pelagibacter sp. TMED166]|tara:strand:- start:42794 stop:43420 length:627 start_codon:yes stop_codon:yes gene_type:complete
MASNLNYFLRHRVFISLMLAPYIILSTFNNKVFLFNIIIIFFLSVYEWNRSISKILDKALGIIILSIFSISLFYINLENNINCIWLLFIVWISDTAGYYIGKKFGKKKLKVISPNKTFEGFFGSLFFSQFAFIFLIYNEILENNLIYIFLLQITICISSIFGDLFFSYYKRKYGLKDYSKILGDHGGVLDRIDGLVISSIIFFIIINL